MRMAYFQGLCSFWGVFSYHVKATPTPKSQHNHPEPIWDRWKVFFLPPLFWELRAVREANAAKNRDLLTANFASGIRPNPGVTLWTYLIGHDRSAIFKRHMIIHQFAFHTNHLQHPKQKTKKMGAWMLGIMFNWLVVSTHLKNISQNGNLPKVGLKIKIVGNHHLVKVNPPILSLRIRRESLGGFEGGKVGRSNYSRQVMPGVAPTDRDENNNPFPDTQRMVYLPTWMIDFMVNNANK